MSSPEIESEIDGLYQLPLDQFTAARNALAKRAGDSRIKSLPKPTLPAWAVNQLHWRKKDVVARVIQARTKLERAQEAALTGGRADVRKAGEEHREAVNEGLKALRQLLEPQELTPDQQHAARRILEGLPAAGQPGRLATTPEPTGFEVFSGIAPGALRLRPPRERARGRARGRQVEVRTREPRRDTAPPAASAAAEASRQEAARAGRKALAEAKRRLQAAKLEARRIQASEKRALARLEEERSREQRAKDLHEEAIERLAGARAESERLRQAAVSASKALRQAEEELERVTQRLGGGA